MTDRAARRVADEARCYPAQQHELVVGRLLRLFPDALGDQVTGAAVAVEPELIAPILDLVDGHRDKQPDWTYPAAYSGQSPADRARLVSGR
ncbi:MAG: hypothetical protein ACRD1K_12255 [Acidimicrobiales bacterium]